MESSDAAEAALFVRVEKTIAENAHRMILDLNKKWRILGVDVKTRQVRTENLIAIVQERYDEVIEETDEKIKIINEEIENIQSDLTRLVLSLNIDANFHYDKDDSLKTRKEILQSELAKFQSIYRVRTDKIKKLNEWQEKLCRLLGFSKMILPDDPLPSENDVTLFEDYLNAQEREYKRRMEIFNQKQSTIKTFLYELEQEPFDSFQRSIIESSGNDFILTDSNMALLIITNDSLEDQLQQKKAEIREIRDRLMSLWDRLEEPQDFREDFLNKYQGYCKSTEAAFAKEIERCEEMRRQNFQKFIHKIREEIKEMWEICFYSESQREMFPDFFLNIYDENMLISHENYLDNLKTYYNDNKHIFDLYETRQKLWLKWKELEEKAMDSGRFQNRGGKLLREEKERKTVSYQLPKIEAEIMQMVEEYASKNRIPFTIDGHNLIEIIQEDWDKKNEERNTKMSARKNKALPFSTPNTAPRSAPQHRRLQPVMNTQTLTAIKRRLSPNHSPRNQQNQLSVRRLQFTPSGPAASPSASNKSKRIKTLLPTITVNGYIQKKRKSVGRLSKESKERKRARKSGSKTPSKSLLNVDNSILSNYSTFQNHLDNNEMHRSSVVPEHNLRPRCNKNETNKFKPDGLTTNMKSIKENLSPSGYTTRKNYLGFSTPGNNCVKSGALNTPDHKVKTNIDVFATPARPLGKLPMQRQNTVIGASPSVANGPRQLRRSNSSNNLKSNVSYYPTKTQRLQINSNLPLII